MHEPTSGHTRTWHIWGTRCAAHYGLPPRSLLLEVGGGDWRGRRLLRLGLVEGGTSTGTEHTRGGLRKPSGGRQIPHCVRARQQQLVPSLAVQERRPGERLRCTFSGRAMRRCAPEKAGGFFRRSQRARRRSEGLAAPARDFCCDTSSWQRSRSGCTCCTCCIAAATERRRPEDRGQQAVSPLRGRGGWCYLESACVVPLCVESAKRASLDPNVSSQLRFSTISASTTTCSWSSATIIVP